MKLIAMIERKGKATAVRQPSERKAGGAFDVWLQRGLHQLFDDVAREPIPEELLKLIEEDRNKP